MIYDSGARRDEPLMFVGSIGKQVQLQLVSGKSETIYQILKAPYSSSFLYSRQVTRASRFRKIINDGDGILPVKGLAFHLEQHLFAHRPQFCDRIIIIPLIIVNQSVRAIAYSRTAPLKNGMRIFRPEINLIRYAPWR